MATRSTIAVVHQNGTVTQVYCHFDGYLDGVGATLVEHYPRLDRVEFLVNLGDISSLGQYATGSEDHSFNNPELDTTVFYGRDRGETGCEPRKFPSLDDYQLYFQAQEYNYLFKDGQWFYKLEVNDPQFHSVEMELAKHKEAQ